MACTGNRQFESVTVCFLFFKVVVLGQEGQGLGAATSQLGPLGEFRPVVQSQIPLLVIEAGLFVK